MMDSKASASPLLPSQTSLPYSILRTSEYTQPTNIQIDSLSTAQSLWMRCWTIPPYYCGPKLLRQWLGILTRWGFRLYQGAEICLQLTLGNQACVQIWRPFTSLTVPETKYPKLDLLVKEVSTLAIHHIGYPGSSWWISWRKPRRVLSQLKQLQRQPRWQFLHSWEMHQPRSSRREGTHPLADNDWCGRNFKARVVWHGNLHFAGSNMQFAILTFCFKFG